MTERKPRPGPGPMMAGELPATSATLSAGGWLVTCTRCGREWLVTPAQIKSGHWLQRPVCSDGGKESPA
ncbi:hypothetical protein [Nitrolancea hollandica]|uniref:hypothetical protein n=1 Tax=Nitrolancea hollandica TaxID=1206749 RepID=UPI00126770AF|nr:hypothetical protein [Nitrolancea hollandica]